MPSQQVRFRQFFPAPPAEVFAYFADHGFDPKIPGTGAVFARWLGHRRKRGVKRALTDLSSGP